MIRIAPCLSIVCLTHGFCTGQTTTQQSRPYTAGPQATVGAIRWDAWFGNVGTVGKAVHRTLSPPKWRDRLPFYARVLGDNTVEMDGSSQATIDREIGYAATAGLNYWAFVTYNEDDPLSLALKRYLTSPVRSKLNFCLITECARWRSQDFVDRVVRLMQEPGYQRVLDGRPLLYFGFVAPEKLKPLDGIDGLRKRLDAFRSTIVAKSLPEPYIVIMDFSAEQGKKWADDLGCDAISSYASGWHHGRVPYARWAGKAETFWDECRKNGAHVVPTVMTGWDPRPRADIPVPWGDPYSSHDGEVDRSDAATPAQIADHLGNAMHWLAVHRNAAPAQTAIIYAWNEFDEGGWLCPTLSEGTARLDAVAKVLRPSHRAGANATSPVAEPIRRHGISD